MKLRHATVWLIGISPIMASATELSSVFSLTEDINPMFEEIAFDAATENSVSDRYLQTDFSQRFSRLKYNDEISNLAIRVDQTDMDVDLFEQNADFEDIAPSTWTFGYALTDDSFYHFAFEFIRLDPNTLDILDPDSVLKELEFVQQLSFRIAY